MFNFWRPYKLFKPKKLVTIYELGRAPMEEYRYYTGSECERIDILAWKKSPNIG